jgi:hypothetical protein
MSTNRRFTGVETLFASTKKVGLTVRILPAFNESIPPSDPAFKTGWTSYRDPNAINPEKGGFLFNKWAQEIRAYRWFGKSESSFISPATMAMLIDDPQPMHKACPIMDLRKFCAKHDTLKHLVEKDVGETDSKFSKATIPASQKLAVFGVAYVHQQQQGAKVALQFLTMGGMIVLRDTLDWPMTTEPQAQAQRDEQWPDYLLGDVTAPYRGARAVMVQKQITNMQARPWCLQFTAHDQRIQGFQAAPIGPEVLAQRYDFMSPDVLNIPTYQEIVEFLYADGVVPREVIAAACGGQADVSTQQPPSFAAAVTGFPGAPAFGGGPASGVFGAPAAPFGGVPAAGGFGGAPASPFGGAPAAPAFGATANPFGAPAAGGFGGFSPPVTFGGAPAFGASQAPATFGGSPAAGGFGGTPAFGASPAPAAFGGTPAADFGAGPAPAADAVPFSWGPPATAPVSQPSPSQAGATGAQPAVSTTVQAPSPTVAPSPAVVTAPAFPTPGIAAAPAVETRYHVAVNKEVLQNIPEGVTRAQIDVQRSAWVGAVVHVMEFGTTNWVPLEEAFGGATATFATPAPVANQAPALAALSAAEIAEFAAINERIRVDASSVTDADIARLGVLQERGLAHRQIAM